ncbi:hypothetical protein TELCIR_12567, partial [Teladorsagia circumcincta]
MIQVCRIIGHSLPGQSLLHEKPPPVFVESRALNEDYLLIVGKVLPVPPPQACAVIGFRAVIESGEELSKGENPTEGDQKVFKTSPLGQFMVSTCCDLECYDFDSFLTKACRWRNEKNTCSWDGDELDFIRMKGSWGESEGDTIFGKSDRADGYFLIAGVQQKLPPMYSAMLVSDPIQCQEGDGILKLKFWASPNIVVEAYNFTLDAFGKQGGAAIIDDISYNTSAVYQCRMIPHYEPPVKLSPKTCSALRCDFESGSCLQTLDSSDWKTSEDPVGSRSSGIRSQL